MLSMNRHSFRELALRREIKGFLWFQIQEQVENTIEKTSVD
jgi:hypothetical protein